MEQGLRCAIETAGSIYKLAKLLGISKQAIMKWHAVPAHRIIEIENIVGVPRETLRPDLYERREFLRRPT